MPRSPNSFDQVLSDVRRSLEGWQQIDPNLTLGQLTLAEVQRQIDSFTKIDGEITAAEIAIAKLRNDRLELRKQMQESKKRILSAIRGIYGDDSSEYEMVGGTRMSERRRPGRPLAPELPERS